jgi:hypothetical protein
MDLITLLVVALVVCLVLVLINHFIPMQPPVRVVLNAIVALLVCCWLLSMVGLGAYNGLLVLFVVVCLILYLINTLVVWTPYPHYQTWLNVVVVIILCVALLYMAGFLGAANVRIPVANRPLIGR